jgi:hypothetical protein
MKNRVKVSRKTYCVYTPHPRGVWILRLQENGDGTRDGLFYDLSQLVALDNIRSYLQLEQVPVRPEEDTRLYKMCTEVLGQVRIYRLCDN